VTRAFTEADVGKSFVCVQPRSDGDQFMEPSEKLTSGATYVLDSVHRGQGVFLGVTCWGSTCSYASDRFEPVGPSMSARGLAVKLRGRHGAVRTDFGARLVPVAYAALALEAYVRRFYGAT
jgi:hypothetical protein